MKVLRSLLGCIFTCVCVVYGAGFGADVGMWLPLPTYRPWHQHNPPFPSDTGAGYEGAIAGAILFGVLGAAFWIQRTKKWS